MSPKVSILIPTYNREKLIAETIESALAQDYQNIEVVVVDNSSEDSTWEVVQEYSRRDSRVVAKRNSENIGPVANWLKCIKYASGEFCKILWSDDLISPDFLSKSVPLMEADVGFVYTSARIFSVSKDVGDVFYSRGKDASISSQAFIEESLFYVGTVPVSPGCALFRLKDVREGLLLDVPNSIGSDFSKHAIGNDQLLYLITATKYKSIVHLSSALSQFRSHDGSISISSETGKLPLHYALAKGYFVEYFAPRYSVQYFGYLLVLLKRFSGASVYGLNNPNDFFPSSFSVNKVYSVLRMAPKIMSLLLKRRLFSFRAK